MNQELHTRAGGTATELLEPPVEVLAPADDAHGEAGLDLADTPDMARVPTLPPGATARPAAAPAWRGWAVILGSIGLLLLAGIFAVGLALSGLFRAAPGPVQTESRTVALQGATTAEVNIVLGAGQLTVRGGAADLLDATFHYDVPQWQPEIDYQVRDGQGHLSIRQPDTEGSIVRSSRYEWDLRLKDGVPLIVRAHLGAAQGDLQLAGLDLTELEVTTGAGTTGVDLTGPRTRDLTAQVVVGAGTTTLRLPRDVGVRVTAQGGFGAVRAGDLTANGHVYTNAAYGKSPVTMNITVVMGAGEVVLEQAP